VTGLVDSTIVQCALIEARRTKGLPERFVIAYPDEKSLRELLAQPNIIACRLASRGEAQANINTDFWTATTRKQTSGGPIADGAEKHQCRVVSAERRLGRGFDLTQTRNIVRVFLQAAVAGAILIFYSRNAVSTIIRSFVVG